MHKYDGVILNSKKGERETGKQPLAPSSRSPASHRPATPSQCIPSPLVRTFTYMSCFLLICCVGHLHRSDGTPNSTEGEHAGDPEQRDRAQQRCDRHRRDTSPSHVHVSGKIATRSLSYDTRGWGGTGKNTKRDPGERENTRERFLQNTKCESTPTTPAPSGTPLPPKPTNTQQHRPKKKPPKCSSNF